MGCIKLDILENHYKTPELKIVHIKKELTSKKSSSEGRNYYHARYYDPKVSVFYGVDPLAEEAPFASPYRYGFNNPIKYIDPNGMFEDEASAQQYQEDNNIQGTISQGTDGLWSINDTENGVSYFKDRSLDKFEDIISRGEDGVIQSATVTGQGSSAQSQGGGWEPYAGTAGAIASEMYYSKTYGTWMGKNFKMYQQTWGGNGYTGGKLKFGKKVSTGIKVGGYGLGIWNAYKINSQHSSGQISDGQMYMEQGSNVITTVGGLYGAAWGVGWELGRAITNTGWYQEAKFNFWYNRWESQVGAPSQSNEALWYYFYQNYKP